MGFQFLGQEDPLEKGMATHSFSCLENPMDGGAWWATVHGVTKSQTQLSDFTITIFLNLVAAHLCFVKPQVSFPLGRRPL